MLAKHFIYIYTFLKILSYLLEENDYLYFLLKKRTHFAEHIRLRFSIFYFSHVDSIDEQKTTIFIILVHMYYRKKSLALRINQISIYFVLLEKGRYFTKCIGHWFPKVFFKGHRSLNMNNFYNIFNKHYFYWFYYGNLISKSIATCRKSSFFYQQQY